MLKNLEFLNCLFYICFWQKISHVLVTWQNCLPSLLKVDVLYFDNFCHWNIHFTIMLDVLCCPKKLNLSGKFLSFEKHKSSEISFHSPWNVHNWFKMTWNFPSAISIALFHNRKSYTLQNVAENLSIQNVFTNHWNRVEDTRISSISSVGENGK